MKKSLTSKVLAVATFAALTSAMFAPLQATASGTAQGHGVKCFFVLVSYDPIMQASVYRTVCGKGV